MRDFCIGAAALKRLEAELAAKAAATLPLLVELAWHLRQRDGRQALALADRAQRLLASDGADLALRARLHLVRAEVDAFWSRIDSAERWLAEARTLLPEAGDPSLAGDALLIEALLARAAGDHARELRACEVLTQGPRAPIAAAMLALLRAAMPGQGTDSGNDDADDANDPVDSDELAAASYANAARALRRLPHDPPAAAGLFRRAAVQAVETGLLRHAVICDLNAADIWRDLADYDAAAACLNGAEQAAERSQAPVLVATCRTRIGCLLRHLGHLSPSRGMLVSALRCFALIPPCLNTANAWYDLALTLIEMGRAAEALEAIGKAISIHGGSVHPLNLTMYRIARARILARAGDPVAALAAIEQARQLIDDHGLAALMLSVDEALAEIHRTHCLLPPPQGMKAPSAAIHYALSALRRGLRIEGWKAPASMCQFLAQAWAEAGDLAQAYDYMQKALEAKELELAMQPKNPKALLRLLLRNGDGAAPLGELPADESALAQKLTPKEREVMRLLAQHQSNKEIALAMGISGETVKTHLRSIYTKLKVGTRRHAIAWARNAGLVGQLA
ncbi:LuxR family transcriptional regulator [Pelomonas sp. KK5]|uniref:LuxR family transcriptional regulator n=1 Tax=Pelomonas sp. KK5 TaxID=1855730 RepID=UPI00097C9B33|nr:LuxR family transcriptional regulator [Pelomonas sp. KK5]